MRKLQQLEEVKMSNGLDRNIKQRRTDAAGQKNTEHPVELPWQQSFNFFKWWRMGGQRSDGNRHREDVRTSKRLASWFGFRGSAVVTDEVTFNMSTWQRFWFNTQRQQLEPVLFMSCVAAMWNQGDAARLVPPPPYVRYRHVSVNLRSVSDSFSFTLGYLGKYFAPTDLNRFVRS